MSAELRPEPFQKLISLYAQTKALIIAAEEADEAVASNIAIIREQRDTLDHLMRVLADTLAEQPRGENYRKDNLDKAIGHLYRAAYDALDSLAIAFKLRLKKALENADNAALSSVFPQYYASYCAEIDQLNERIKLSRSTKDVGTITDNHIEEYRRAVDRLAQITREAEQKVTALTEYAARNKKNARRELVQKLLLMLLSALLALALARLFR